MTLIDWNVLLYVGEGKKKWGSAQETLDSDLLSAIREHHKIAPEVLAP
jgi:hypothetical protein